MEQENWITYSRELEETVVIGSVDLGFLPDLPDADRPQVVRVALAFEHFREDGMPAMEEMELCDRVEESLLGAVGPSRAVLVGRRVGMGQRDWFFYAPTGEDAADAAREVMNSLDGREWSIDALEDPEWGFYAEELLPTAEEFRRSSDALVVMQLEEAGDPLVVPRPVTHYLFFQDAKSRDDFAASAASQGFTAESFENDEEDGGDEEGEGEDEPGRFGLSLERENAVDLDSINEVTWALTEAAEDAGGEYDGWEARVVGPDGKLAEEG